MKSKMIKKSLVILLALSTVLNVSCAQMASKPKQSFAEAHDAFQTTLVREENDDEPIPAPPEGAFELVKYSSKVGDLAAYVSSDPGDGQKHPMIIWVVGD